MTLIKLVLCAPAYFKFQYVCGVLDCNLAELIKQEKEATNRFQLRTN